MPIIIDCDQGTPAWHEARAGVPTASCFHRIITPAKMQLSAQRHFYAYQLLAEKLMRESPEPIDHLPAIERGKALEPQAIAAYELQKDVTARKVGFVLTDDRRYGASPDRILDGAPGLLEIKCPLGATMLDYHMNGFSSDHKCQYQGQMLVCERDFVDLYAYHPRLTVEHRYTRDEPFITKLREALNIFCDELTAMEAKLRATGFFADPAAGDDEWWDEYLSGLDEQARFIDAG